MRAHSLWWNYVWIAPHVLQGIIVVVMIRRRLFHEFPMFFAYTVLQIVQFITLFTLDHSSAVSAEQYWNANWAGIALSALLRFAVIAEIFAHVFRPYPAIGELGRLLFRWSTVILLFVGIVVAAYAPDNGTNRLFSGIHVVDRSVGLMQCGLLVFLLLFASYFRLSWRSCTYGIALGLGIVAGIDLASGAVRVWTGPAAHSHLFDFLTMATYHCCVLIWLVYLLVPDSNRRTVKQLPDNNLEQWNAELQRLLLS